MLLAGQPGAGKGGLAKAALLEMSGDLVAVDPDELRKHHPSIQTLHQQHPYTWPKHTHPDASRWADELLDAVIDGRKNLIYDTTLANGEWGVEVVKRLQAAGYDVEVRAVAAHKLESEGSVEMRFSRVSIVVATAATSPPKPAMRSTRSCRAASTRSMPKPACGCACSIARVPSSTTAAPIRVRPARRWSRRAKHARRRRA